MLRKERMRTVSVFRRNCLCMKRIRNFFTMFKNAFGLFNEHNGLKLSAALSYYTVFSLGPLLVIIVSVAGIFFGKKAVQGKVYGQISGLVGKDAALQIQQIMQNIQQSHHSIIGGIIGFIILIIGASGVFSEIQESINYLWSVEPKAKKKFLQAITRKLLSFSLLAGMSFVLLVSLIINSLIDVLSERLKSYFPEYAFYLFYVLNIFIILFIITWLFTMIFKVLPGARISTKHAFVGASFTAILFLIGKFIIGFYLGNSKIGLTYGATASVVVTMLWVYYSSIILYFGAAFTKIYSDGGKPVEAPRRATGRTDRKLGAQQ